MQNERKYLSRFFMQLCLAFVHSYTSLCFDKKFDIRNIFTKQIAHYKLNVYFFAITRNVLDLYIYFLFCTNVSNLIPV